MKPHIYHPRAGDVVEPVGDQAEQLAGDRAEQLAGDRTPPAPTVNLPLRLAIAKDETEVYRRHLAGLVALWDAMGVMGLVCARQDQVTEFLAKMHEVKSVLKQ